MNIAFKNYQTGLSLVELMLAMFISLLVLQQAHQLLLTLVDNYTLLERDIESDEGKQISLIILKHFVSLSGYKEFSSTNTVSVFAQTSNFKDGTFVFGLNNVTNKAAVMKGSDVLMIRFQTPSTLQMRDCKNTLLEANKNYTLDFYIDQNSDFRCKGAASRNHLRYSAVLAHGISDFQVEYAYKTAGELKFCDADCINTRSMWKHVVALRLRLKNKRYRKTELEVNNVSGQKTTSTHTLYFDNAFKD